MRERRHPAGLGEAADPAEVEHDDLSRSGLDQRPERSQAGQGLAHGHRDGGAGGEGGRRGQVVRLDRVLEPVHAQRLDGPGDLQRRAEVPDRVQLQHDVHRIADGLADLRDHGDPGAEVRGRDVIPLGRRRVGIERPDLHRADALVEQLPGELGRPVDGQLQVFVGLRRPVGRQQAVLGGGPPIGRPERAARRAPVSGSRAGVVDARRWPGGAAQQVRDRAVHGLTADIPQGQVYGRQAASLGARPLIPEKGPGKLVPVLANQERILPHQVRRDRLVDVRGHRRRPDARLAEPDDALVGVDLYP